MKSDTSLVAIRGTKHGLTITLQEGPVRETLVELNERLSRTASFFRGAQLTLIVENSQVGPPQLEEINRMLTPYEITLRRITTDNMVLASAGGSLGLQVSAAGAPVESMPQTPPRAAPPAPVAMAAVPEPDTVDSSESYPAIVVRRTLRSGASIRHEGHIIVVGDVNPGAELIATGDVIVWGKLRGLVHAGALGDSNAIVCALRFEPTQLRIGNSIARMPEGRKRKSAPEIALIRAGKIEVVEWS